MTTNFLILCTHNSARSILAEAMLNHLAAEHQKNVRAYSAGSSPSGKINPFAIDVLEDAGVSTVDFKSKNWDEFSRDGGPVMRAVITVCDNAAAETCPYWPGSPVQVHWGYPDPSNAIGGDNAKRAAFELTRQAISYRMLQLLSLPLDQMSDDQLRVSLV